MKLSEWRKSHGFSQAQAATLIEVTQPAYCRYESGRNMPRPEVMARIREVTGGTVTANDFYAAPSTPFPLPTPPERP